MADNSISDTVAELTGLESELKRIDDLADGVGRALTTALRGAITDGKSLKSVLSDVASAFADVVLKAALEPVGSLVSSLVSSLFTATDTGLTGFAKGGVLSSPSYFPTGQGLAVAGEAGAEAVLPLTRGSDGRLGIAGGGSGVNVTFNVTASDARSFAASEAELSAMLLRAVRRGTRAS